MFTKSKTEVKVHFISASVRVTIAVRRAGTGRGGGMNTEAPSVETEKKLEKSFLPINFERSRTRMKAGCAHALARERVQMSRDCRCYTGAQCTVE